MLNVIVRQHPKVAAVSPVELDADQLAQVEQIARRALVTVVGDMWEVSKSR